MVVLLRTLVLLVVCGQANSGTTLPPSRTESEVNASTSRSSSGRVNSGNCLNPLFETHWAGKSDIRHLSSEPKVQRTLFLCKAWNGRPACCTQSFEEEQSKAFKLWEDHWRAKAKHVEHFQAGMEQLKVTDTYKLADPQQQALFDIALKSIAPVLATYGTCFDTLLEYMAGMLCFTCQPHWQHQVLTDPSGVRAEHLRVDDSSNEELWQSCRFLGSAAKELERRVSDSLLAKAVTSRFEDLTMFVDRIHVSEYMERFGMIAMRGPNELERDDTVQLDGSTPFPILRLTSTAAPASRPAASTAEIGTSNTSSSTASSSTANSTAVADGNDSSADQAEVRSLASTPEELQELEDGLVSYIFGGSSEHLPIVKPSGLLMPVQDGRASGFICSVFPRSPLRSGLWRPPGMRVLIGALATLASSLLLKSACEC